MRNLVIRLVLSTCLLATLAVAGSDNTEQPALMLARVMETSSFYKQYPYQINIVVTGHGPKGDFRGQFWRDALSETQWRTRVDISGYSEWTVRNGDHKWHHANIEFEPALVDELWTYLQYPPELPILAPPLKSRKKPEMGASVTCMEYQSPLAQRVCVDSGAGHLLQVTTALLTATYSDFQTFEGKSVAHKISIDTIDGKHLDGLLNVSDGKSLTPDMFSPPPGAELQEEPVCGVKKAAHVEYAPDPKLPDIDHSKLVDGTVLLKAWVGKDGRVKHVEVYRSMGELYDREALKAVSQWRFKPAECDGNPVEMKNTIEVNFRIYR